MSKPLSKVSDSERESVVNRRLAQSVKGLGYWAAHDYRAKHGGKAKLESVLQVLRASKHSQNNG